MFFLSQNNNSIFSDKKITPIKDERICIPRNIRVFISSTFHDMQEERDYLVHKVFPKIRITAEKRGVNFVGIDLRWGITQEEEDQSGKIIYSCLKEIENSRPYFIGLLGDRYGWCPRSNDLLSNEDFYREYAWIYDDIRHNLSITEIEIQYGVLRNKLPINAFFYIKKSQQSKAQPSFFSRIFGQPSDEQKQIRLKNEIRSQQIYPYYEYETVEEMGVHIEQTLTELMNRLFPEKEMTVLEKMRLEQHAFVKTQTTAYIKIAGAFETISTFSIHPSYQLLCISGQSGLGKSALISNWITECGNNAGRHIICHYIANTEDGGRYGQVMFHLVEELCDRYHLSYTHPQQGQQTKWENIFADLLAREVVQKNPPILIIDAIDQLRDEDKGLSWMPTSIGKEKWILSAADGDIALDAINSYVSRFPGKAMHYHLDPLPEAQRHKLIVTYLRMYGKELEKRQIDKILKSHLVANTLVLKVLLDELIVYGIYDKLDERITYYTNAFNIENFFQRMLHRYEQDYGKSVIKNTLTLLALSRYGLTETALLHLGNIRPIEWSPFFCAFSRHLISRNGYISFSHCYIKNAVKSIYMIDDVMVFTLRKQLARYMKEQAHQRGQYLICDYEEIPYQLCLSSCWDELYDFLLDLDVLNYFAIGTDDNWAMFWRSLYEIDPKKYTIRKFIDVFKQSKLTNEKIDDKLLDLERTARNFLSTEDAMILAEYALGLNSKISLATAFHHQLYIVDHFIATAQLDKAFNILNELIKKCTYLPVFHIHKSLCLMRLADIYEKKGAYSKAKTTLLEATQLDSGQGTLPLSYGKFSKLGAVCICEKNYDEAEKYLRQALTLCKKGNLEKRTMNFLDILSQLGKVATLKGNLEQAMNYYQEELYQAEQILSPVDCTFKLIYLNIANIYGKMGKSKEQQNAFVKAASYEAFNVIDNYRKMYQMAFETMQRGEYEYAIKLYQDFLKVISSQNEVFNNERFEAYVNMGVCYHCLGDTDTAICFYEIAKPEMDKLEGKKLDRISLFYLNYGIALYTKKRNKETIEMMRRYINIKSRPNTYNMPNELQTARLYLENSLFAYGQDCLNNKDYIQAAQLYDETIGINRTFFNDNNLPLQLNQAGLAYGYMKKYATALNYHIEAMEELKRQGVSAEDKRLVAIYQNIGFDYRHLGEGDKAKEFLDYAEFLINKK